jgi:hypothetical protein
LSVIADAGADRVTLPLVAEPDTVAAVGTPTVVKGGATASQVVPVSLKLPPMLRATAFPAPGRTLVKGRVQVAGCGAPTQLAGVATIKPFGSVTAT